MSITTDLNVDNSEDGRATKVLNRLKRGAVGLLCYGLPSSPCTCVEEKVYDSRLINLTAGARQEGS